MLEVQAPNNYSSRGGWLYALPGAVHNQAGRIKLMEHNKLARRAPVDMLFEATAVMGVVFAFMP